METKEQTMEKKLYWLVESNEDLSNTVITLAQAYDLIHADFYDYDADLGEREELQYTITPTYLTDKEYKELPED